MLHILEQFSALAELAQAGLNEPLISNVHRVQAGVRVQVFERQFPHVQRRSIVIITIKVFIVQELRSTNASCENTY
jgi:hypothetical protein